MSRARNWCFTSYEAEAPKYSDESMNFMCYQQEICPSSEKHHWQGYVCFKEKLRMNPIKKILGNTVHLEVAKGSHKQARDYCKKKESAVPDTYEEFGEIPKDNCTSNFRDVVLAVKAGAKLSDLAESDPTIIARYSKCLQQFQTIVRKPPPVRPLANLCLWGAAGVGKTKWVYDNFNDEDVYFKDKSEWWDGYEGQKVIVWDDFYGEQKISNMLNWMDIYRQRVQVKGGYTWLSHTYNVFTSNSPPEDWYAVALANKQDVRAAFTRRLPPSNAVEIRSGCAVPDLTAWDFAWMYKEREPGPQ